MDNHTSVDLKELAREAVRLVAAPGDVEEIDVVAGEDFSERPIYTFSFLIPDRLERARAGLLRTRLSLKLRDLLIDARDGRYPMVQILKRTEWSNRQRA